GRAQAGHRFAAVMVDVDDFKRINDTLGHSVGDVALAQTARLLKSCVRTGDVVARFGGDEFFVLLDVETTEELEEVVGRMRTEEDVFNRGDHPYLLGLSKGYDFYDPERFATIKEFEEYLDNLMYADKEQRRAQSIGSIPLANRRGA
ncbi:MAG: GGDEF domain-containing protein, partial [Eggerthellaceae bacterium]|nr:GGDEF domain-containing protein [Eggerthellaceae bacterium]